MTVAFNENNQREIEEILSHYPTKQAALLPLLHLAQKEFGWISPEVMELVAGRLDLSPAHVYGVVTFYSMFLLTPPAKYHLQVCRTLSCAMARLAPAKPDASAQHGVENPDSPPPSPPIGVRLVDYLEKKLGIKAGEATKDGRFRLTEVECLASCGTAPMMRVNEAYHESLTEEKIDRLFEEWNRT